MKRRWATDHIGFDVGLAASTVQGILNRAGVGRLDRGDGATSRRPVRRYQRDTPGELLRVDIKKLAGIPDGGGWRTRGRGCTGEGAKARMVGYRYIHTAIDDRGRIVYLEILGDENAVTAAGFRARAAAWYQANGIESQRVITDNGSCYRSGLWHRACAATGTKVTKTRPFRPQINGKASNGSTESCSKNGPTSGPGNPKPNEATRMPDSSTSAITTDPTDHSDGQPQPASSRTTSPKSAVGPPACATDVGGVSAVTDDGVSVFLGAGDYDPLIGSLLRRCAEPNTAEASSHPEVTAEASGRDVRPSGSQSHSGRHPQPQTDVALFLEGVGVMPVISSLRTFSSESVAKRGSTASRCFEAVNA